MSLPPCVLAERDGHRVQTFVVEASTKGLETTEDAQLRRALFARAMQVMQDGVPTGAHAWIDLGDLFYLLITTRTKCCLECP